MDITIKGGMTVRDLFARAQTQWGNLTFRDTLYPGVGHMIVNINGYENGGKDGKNWMFCYNGVIADKGIDDIIVESGAEINWYYTTREEMPCKKVGE